MKKSFVRRAIVAALLVAMVVTSVAPCCAYGRTENESLSAVRKAGVMGNILKGLRPLDGSLYGNLLYGGDNGNYALGVASHFTLFAKNVRIAGNADCEGRIAADEFTVDTCPGGGYPVLGKLTSGKNKSGAADIICNNAISKSFGNVDYAYSSGNGTHTYVVSDEVTTILAPFYASWLADGIRNNTYTVPKNSLINFDAELSKLVATANRFASMSNGTVSDSWGNLSLSGKDAKLNIFTLDQNTWNKANTIMINVPSGSFVIINVAGKNVAYGNAAANCTYINGNLLTQNSAENNVILYNFYEAENVKLVSPNRGSVLAPKAYVEDVCDYQHNAAQIIANSIYIKNEMGAFGFLMPFDYLGLVPETEKAYTVHYMYYTAEGEIKEMPADVYRAFIGSAAAPMPGKNKVSEAYQFGDSVQAADEAGQKAALADFVTENDLKIYADLFKNGCDIRFEVYEDGKDWNKAISGNDMTKVSALNSMTRKADISWKDTYEFGDSNVYFIMYPMAKVTVDVSWDDKHNKSGKRPSDMNVALVENVPDSNNGKNVSVDKDNVDLLKGTSNTVVLPDETLNKNIEYDVFDDGYVFYVPLFGRQADVTGKNSSRTYGSTIDKFGENGLFDIRYDIPKEYSDVTVTKVEKPAGAAIVDENGVVANYHIVLRGEYKAIFYVIDESGKRYEVFKDDFFNLTNDEYEKFRGLSSTDPLPELTNTEINSILGKSYTNPDYSVTWKDIKTGKNYVGGLLDDTYTFDYEDVIFETTVRRTETIDETPWLYVNIITYRNSHYIPGKMAWQRMKMDNTFDPSGDGFTFIQSKKRVTGYSYGSLMNGEYADDKFLLLSFIYGVDTDKAVATRVTVSTKGFSTDDDIFFTSENRAAKSEAFGLYQTYRSMSGSKASTIKELVPQDAYVEDYDGMCYYRLALPAEEYENATLYFTVYNTDETGREYVWFYYLINMNKNKFWTLQKDCAIVVER